MSVSYQEFKPSPELSKYIDCFWISKGFRSVNEKYSMENRVLPDGCMDILFDFVSANKPSASIVGTMSCPLILNSMSSVDFLGIRFLPGKIGSFFKINAIECTDQIFDLSLVIQKEAAEWQQNLMAVSASHAFAGLHNSRRIAFCERFLLRRFNQNNRMSDPCIQYCIDHVYVSKGSLDLRFLEMKTGLSIRQIERKFSKDIGLSPKQFARVVRFQSVDLLIKNTKKHAEIDWTDIAMELGYYDHSHLIREFKQFSGFSPERYYLSSGI